MKGYPGWAGRAQRAHRNMLENVVLFAALVLVAVVVGKTNATTLMGAQIFVWARLVYARDRNSNRMSRSTPPEISLARPVYPQPPV